MVTTATSSRLEQLCEELYWRAEEAGVRPIPGGCATVREKAAEIRGLWKDGVQAAEGKLELKEEVFLAEGRHYSFFDLVLLKAENLVDRVTDFFCRVLGDPFGLLRRLRFWSSGLCIPIIYLLKAWKPRVFGHLYVPTRILRKLEGALASL